MITSDNSMLTAPEKIILLSERLFLLKSNVTAVQIFRYLLVGGIAAIIDFGIFMLVTTVYDQHYILAQTAGFTAGIATNYTLSRLWIFESRYNRITETSLFLLTGLIGLLFSYFLLWLLIDVFHILWYGNGVAKILTILLVLLWNFSSRKWFVFA